MTRKTGKKRGGGKPKPKILPSSPNSVPPPPSVEPEAAAIDVLTGDDLRHILRRLSLADLLRAALACHRWRRVAARCLPRAPPLLGYFFHPVNTPPPPPIRAEPAHYDAVFAPLDSLSPRLSLDFAPEASRFGLYDCHQGLLLLQPPGWFSKSILPRLLVLDPATRRSVLLPPPPRDTVPDDRRWRSSRYYIGSALLTRAHPTKLCFEAVCFAIDGGHPRAWVASVDNGDCSWRALSRDKDVLVDFDPHWFKRRCVGCGGGGGGGGACCCGGGGGLAPRTSVPHPVAAQNDRDCSGWCQAGGVARSHPHAAPTAVVVAVEAGRCGPPPWLTARWRPRARARTDCRPCAWTPRGPCVARRPR